MDGIDLNFLVRNWTLELQLKRERERERLMQIDKNNQAYKT